MHDEQNLGCFEGVQSKIDMGDAKPVQQPVRCTLLGFQGEKETHLMKLLNNDIIKTLSSEWASPVVLL